MKKLFLFVLLLLPMPASATETIRLANNPALSPDGATLAFDWNGDIWTVPTSGGAARQLTMHPAKDREPKFSPDGKEIAFISERDGSPQVYVMPAAGGEPRRLTYNTAGYILEEWTPDGQSLIVSGQRDHYWRHAERFFRISAKERGPETPLFDDYGKSGTLSADGKSLLFTREGAQWWRKGYHGSQASQIWQYDVEQHSFKKLLGEDHGDLWPLWRPDGKGFYYVAGQNGSWNLWECDLSTSNRRQLTRFEDDSVVFPCISRDGSTIVFRQLFDLYRYRPGSTEPPTKINITCNRDRSERKDRRTLTQATDVAFSADGLEVAFVAGGDLWVMDTELREPKQITSTAEEERQPLFSPDGDSLLFMSDKGGQCDIWKAERADKSKYWWQNNNFKLERITNDADVESSLKWSPDGKHIAFVKGRGNLMMMDADGKNVKSLLPGWDKPEYDWSPDGKWIVYGRYDSDFNRDIWIMPIDGSRQAVNISRHPYNEHAPIWSPDGKVIAFTGQRERGETDIFYVFLQAEEDEKSTRDRNLEKALDKMKKGRMPTPAGGGARRIVEGDGDAPKAEDRPTPRASKSLPKVVIDFDRIHERVHRVSIPDSTESNLFWSPDSKKLAFTSTVEGRRGTYTIEIPDDLKPKLLSQQTGANPVWLSKGNQIVWLANGVPGSISGAGTPTPATTVQTPAAAPAGRGRGPQRTTPTPAAPSATAEAAAGTGYRFTAMQEVDLGKKYAAAFDLAWRTMRDNWYDDRMGNRDWNAIRTKYIDMAAQAPDGDALGTVVNLMLGELNGSHLGFSAGVSARPSPDAPEPALGATWRESTWHLGLRFDPDFKGTGLRVKDVIPNSPADHKKTKIEAGETVVSIAGKSVDAGSDLSTALNLPPQTDVEIKVRDKQGKERDVTLRPISYNQIRTLLYEKWIKDNQKTVETASNGKLGYLHISAMAMPSFYRFEQELYAVGHGKDGLVIDVRENGGGSTADHLLTALTQPVHAIAVPRGGEPGYPNDRKVYASWNKPIVVLCNQNSFSNAEIFSHAIKTLKRGQLVGVPTAGGVISTGGTPIMDVGFLRLPFRGWYLVGDGEDMELNGAVPQHIVWPEPGDMPKGNDVQLAKAVEVLSADVKAWKSRPQPALRKATMR